MMSSLNNILEVIVLKIENIPCSERPRERLKNVGVENLSNNELLSIILKTGTKDKNVMELSYEILKMVGDIKDFKDLTLQRLIEVKGVGEVKAIELISVVEFGKRIFFRCDNTIRKKFTNAKEIYLDNKYLFVDKKQEYFYCFYFNTKQELIERKLLFMGTINRSCVHPREVFKEAYMRSASSIICIHNHPSGDTKPSREDIHFTKALKEIGDTFGIPVLDHIIVSDNNYYSFYEESNIFVS